MDDIKAKIRTELEKFWDERSIPAGPDGDTLVTELSDPLESIAAVGALGTIERALGFKMPLTSIQPGGYRGKDEFLEKLGAKALECYAAKKP
jgi:hypothetical protein